MDENFWRDQKPKKYFRGNKIKFGIFMKTIYLFNPSFNNNKNDQIFWRKKCISIS